MKPSQAQLDIMAPAAAAEAAKPRAATYVRVGTSAQARATVALQNIAEAKESIRRASLRGWSGGTGKHGGWQEGTVQVAAELPADRIVALYAAPECGCGSHTATECPDCGLLVCASQGHPRHVCAAPDAGCLRCESSGKVAGTVRGVPWPEWLRRAQRDPGGELVAGFVRFPPSAAALAAVRPTACPRCGGRP